MFKPVKEKKKNSIKPVHFGKSKIYYFIEKKLKFINRDFEKT